MSLKLAIIDTCFLIDWVRFKRREILFKIFQNILIPEQVLSEIEDEKTILWLSKELARGGFTLFTPSPQDFREAEKLILEVLSKPYLKRIEIPEAICLVIGRKLKAIVLTENRGAFLAVQVLESLRNVIVWRALEVLKEAIKMGILKVKDRDEALSIFKEYEENTHHLFPRKDLKEALEDIARWLKV